MKVLKKANQKNVALEVNYYSQEELTKMLRERKVGIKMATGMNALRLHQAYEEKWDIEFDTWYLLGYKLHIYLLAKSIKHKYFRNSKQVDVLRFETKEDKEKALDIYRKYILNEGK